MSKIIKFYAENFKKLKVVEFEVDPTGNLVVVAGRNAQGKTSILDAISAALGGVNKRDIPKPIRDGEDSAIVILETEDLVITRRFTHSGSSLVVTTHDGAKFPKGQAKLNDLIGKLSLDPLAFTQLDDKKQLEALLDLVELPFDPAELEDARKRCYDDRTLVGRESKALGTIVVDEDLPTQEQSATDLISWITASHDKNRRINQARTASMELQDRIERLEAELAQARTQLDQALEVAQQDEVDVTLVEAQLATIEETNAAIRANNQARERKRQQEALDADYQNLTATIEQLDRDKEEGLAQADMPVEGLGFDEYGITYQGQPFRQASAAEQLEVSLAMAIALNPKLRVIRITDGSLLDADHLAIVKRMAEEHDAQVWLEIVGDGDGTGIIIEEGEIAA